MMDKQGISSQSFLIPGGALEGRKQLSERSQRLERKPLGRVRWAGREQEQPARGDGGFSLAGVGQHRSGQLGSRWAGSCPGTHRGSCQRCLLWVWLCLDLKPVYLLCEMYFSPGNRAYLRPLCFWWDGRKLAVRIFVWLAFFLFIFFPFRSAVLFKGYTLLPKRTVPALKMLWIQKCVWLWVAFNQSPVGYRGDTARGLRVY